jgi:hypothetical protein
LQSFQLFLFDSLEVMGVDVMPELPQQDFVGVVLNVGLRVGDLEIGAELVRKGKMRIVEDDRRLKITCECRP